MKSIRMASALILLSATAAFAHLPLPLPTPTPTPAPTPTPPPPPVLPITLPFTLTVARNEAFGSYDIGDNGRAGGGGALCDFLLVTDPQQIDAGIEGKFDALQSTITNPAGSMPPDVVATLQTDLGSAHTLYQSGAIRDALDAMRVFSRYV